MSERERMIEAMARALCCIEGVCFNRWTSEQHGVSPPFPCAASMQRARAEAALSALEKEWAVVPKAVADNKGRFYRQVVISAHIGRHYIESACPGHERDNLLPYVRDHMLPRFLKQLEQMIKAAKEQT